MKRTTQIVVLGTIITSLMSGCGGSSVISDPVASPTPSISSAAETSKAVVRIVVEGTIITPKGPGDGGGSGSGFIISSDGTIVTNNHVVAGAANVQVFIPGQEKPLPAKILGTSECSDLAVIDVKADELPTLSWHEEEVAVGLKVFAAGYPLGDPSFTLTDGIISKTDAATIAAFTGVGQALEHTANINPGNSGGPLVDETGKVVGVNYLSFQAPSATQFFAIATDEAMPIVEELKEGRDILAIGIHGEATALGPDSDKIPGIWVYGVRTGSRADKVGIKGGDFILKLEDLPVGLDMSIEGYCKILRSHELSDAMKVAVLRPSTGEILEGTLNGHPLQVVSTINPGGTGSTGGLSTLTHNSGSLRMGVLSAWTQKDSACRWMDGDQDIGPCLAASSDLDAFYNGWATSGIYVAASSAFGADADINALLDGGASGFAGCTYAGRHNFDGTRYDGVFDAWENCGGQTNNVVVLLAQPSDKSFLVFAQAIVVNQTEGDAMPSILNSIEVIGSP